MESPIITRDDDYDDPKTDSKYNLFRGINYRHDIYQTFYSPEDSLAAELKVSMNAIRLMISMKKPD